MNRFLSQGDRGHGLVDAVVLFRRIILLLSEETTTSAKPRYGGMAQQRPPVLSGIPKPPRGRSLFSPPCIPTQPLISGALA